VLLLNECLLFLAYIPLSTQSGNFWLHTRIRELLSVGPGFYSSKFLIYFSHGNAVPHMNVLFYTHVKSLTISEEVFTAWCLIKQWIRLHGMVLSEAQEQLFIACCIAISNHALVQSSRYL